MFQRGRGADSEELFPTSADEATTENTSHDTTVALPPLDTAANAADSDPVVGIHPSAKTIGMLRRWTPEVDAKLTGAVTNTCKKKCGKEYTPDWLFAQVPGRRKRHCRKRWNYALNLSIDHASERTGKWTVDEVKKLISAVTNTCRKKCGKESTPDWVAIPRRFRIER
jgi:hypothetical protein